MFPATNQSTQIPFFAPFRLQNISLRPVIIAVAFYYLLIIVAISFIHLFDLPLIVGEGIIRFPSTWLFFILAMYYVGPFVMGIIIGFRQHRFVSHFLITTILIFSIHFLYSVAVTGIRYIYVRSIYHHYQMAQTIPLTVDQITVTPQIANDGFVHSVTLNGYLDFQALPPGYYDVEFNLTQADQSFSFPYIRVDTSGKNPRDKQFSLSFDPTDLANFTLNEPVQLAFRLSSSPPSDFIAPRIIIFCRWSPFFCPTDHEGWDRDLKPLYSLVQSHPDIYQFTFPQNTVLQSPLTFMKFIDDTPQDVDGNGIYDQLIVSMQVESRYTGPLYFQSQINEIPQLVLQSTAYISNQGTRLDFVIDGSELKRSKTDGSYTLIAFVVSNNSFQCPEGNCQPVNRPSFSLTLDRYVTKHYLYNQFE